MREYFDYFLDWIGANEPWKPVSRWAIAAWLVFYVWFLIYAIGKPYLFIDSVNLVVHEAGHPLFGYLGPGPGVWGGTILQWAVPFMLATWFYRERQVPGFVFCLFFFFENWLHTATYMADARAMELPLVTIGDPEFAKHDWNVIFGSLGVLDYDTRIAGTIRFFGWTGMIGTTTWLAARLRIKQEASDWNSIPTAILPGTNLLRTYTPYTNRSQNGDSTSSSNCASHPRASVTPSPASTPYRRSAAAASGQTASESSEQHPQSPASPR
jgi:hypothetical protein